MLQSAHTTSPRVATTHTRESLHGRPGSRLMESAGCRLGASLVPAPPLGALTLGVLSAGGDGHEGLQARMPGLREAGGPRRYTTWAELATGLGSLLPNPPSPARLTAWLDEPPTPAHGPSTGPQPSLSLSRSIFVPRSILGSSWCLRLC